MINQINIEEDLDAKHIIIDGVEVRGALARRGFEHQIHNRGEFAIYSIKRH